MLPLCYIAGFLIEVLIKPSYKVRRCLFVILWVSLFGINTLVLGMGKENKDLYNTTLAAAVVILLSSYIYCLCTTKDRNIVHLNLAIIFLGVVFIFSINILLEIKKSLDYLPLGTIFIIVQMIV